MGKVNKNIEEDELKVSKSLKRKNNMKDNKEIDKNTAKHSKKSKTNKNDEFVSQEKYDEDSTMNLDSKDEKCKNPDLPNVKARLKKVINGRLRNDMMSTKEQSMSIVQNKDEEPIAGPSNTNDLDRNGPEKEKEKTKPHPFQQLTMALIVKTYKTIQKKLKENMDVNFEIDISELGYTSWYNELQEKIVEFVEQNTQGNLYTGQITNILKDTITNMENQITKNETLQIKITKLQETNVNEDIIPSLCKINDQVKKIYSDLESLVGLDIIFNEREEMIKTEFSALYIDRLKNHNNIMNTFRKLMEANRESVKLMTLRDSNEKNKQ